MPKDVTLYVRVAETMSRDLELLAHERGESVSVIVREALREYITARSMAALKTAVRLNETASIAPGDAGERSPISYKSRSLKP